MEYITIGVSVLSCLIGPILQNSNLGRDITRDLRLIGSIEKDVQAWVVKDKFTKSKIKYFYSLEEANQYSKSLWVSNVIFGRNQQIISINGIGFGKKICIRSGSAFLKKYYSDLKKTVDLKTPKKQIKSLIRLLDQNRHRIPNDKIIYNENIIKLLERFNTRLVIYYDNILYIKSRQLSNIIIWMCKVYKTNMNNQNIVSYLLILYKYIENLYCNMDLQLFIH